MTWSPVLTEVTPGPTSTTMPAPSWPRIAGKRPSGSAPERVYSSVWQMPVALISTITSPALGPSGLPRPRSERLPRPERHCRAHIHVRSPPRPSAIAAVIDATIIDRKQQWLGEGGLRSFHIPLSAAGLLAVLMQAAPAQSQGAPPGTWTLKAPRPDLTNEAAAVAIGGRLLAPGGSKQSRSMTRLDEYDPASDRWRARASLPQPLDHLGVAVVNGKLYTAGGFDSTVHRNAADAFLEYDPAMDSWRPLAPLKAPLGALGVAVLDGQIHVIGRRQRGHGLVDTHPGYEPAHGRRRRAPP